MEEYKRFLNSVEELIFYEKPPVPADAIFVPGNGFPQMAERAAELYHQGLASIIVPSGKYSVTMGHFAGVQYNKERYNGEYETEWEFLRDVLLKNKIPEEAILREDKATYTYENARFTKEVTTAAGINVKKAILCCRNYHARRALMYYQTVFPDTEFFVVSCSLDGITKENWNQSEDGIAAVTGEINRIIQQFSLMM